MSLSASQGKLLFIANATFVTILVECFAPCITCLTLFQPDRHGVVIVTSSTESSHNMAGRAAKRRENVREFHTQCLTSRMPSVR